MPDELAQDHSGENSSLNCIEAARRVADVRQTSGKAHVDVAGTVT